MTSLVVERPVVRIIRSANRRRTVTARWAEAGTVLEILAPAGMPEAELAPIVERLKERLERHRDRAENADDAQLARRAMEINREMFAGRLHWREIRYVANQERRFGSCTPGTGIIRISHRVAHMPPFVRDYVLVHELAHLLEANHGPRFWRLVNRYPRTERARGYLMALGLEAEDSEPGEPDVE